ncbi:MAG TPA: hypothetical protein VMJ64_19120 [Anaerolineales bacterium]|nr:hypothetical protein [Anaerolineales bacterium]
MSLTTEFEKRLPAALRQTFQGLRSPIDVQRYLDSLAYIGEERDRCPLDVMKDGQCHCLDGGLFAALALRRLGDPGLLVDLVPLTDANGVKQDDDHVLAVFRRHDRWGCVAKSNYPWLRYRDPVYRSVRELVMSYFEAYFSENCRKVLRGYTKPFDIARCDPLNYAWDEQGAVQLYRRFYARKAVPLIPPASEKLLEPADQREYDSAFLGIDWRWVYRPGQTNTEH